MGMSAAGAGSPPVLPSGESAFSGGAGAGSSGIGRAETKVFRGRVVIAGNAAGEVLHADEPLSFWGGYDAASGRITDTHHPLAGQNAAGGVLILPATRGSSTTTAVLLEAIRCGTAPAALITRGVDAFLALAGVVGEEMYGRSPALVAVDNDVFRALADWRHLELAGGRLIPAREV